MRGMYFYPRSPCGERPSTRNLYKCSNVFLSTLSLRRATKSRFKDCPRIDISIHALLAESDFNVPFARFAIGIFLSTLSLRRATFNVPFARFAIGIFLSTLSLRRATIGPLIFSVQPRNFYPRSPCGERRQSSAKSTPEEDFYPRSPCGERPAFLPADRMSHQEFLSTLSLRRATSQEVFRA